MLTHKFFKPVSAGGVINIIDEHNIQRLLSVEAAEKKFNIKWLEFNKSGTNIYDKLQVRYMGQDLGWGLFAIKDIDKNEVIGVLSGEVYFQDRDKEITSEHILLSDAPNNQFQIVDASKTGNLTRFIQHLPTKEVLKEIEFKQESQKKEVATCNIKHQIIELETGVVTEQYSAARFIKAGEILGSNYDPIAWLKKQPLLFKRDGSIILKDLYNYTVIAPTIKYSL